MNPLEHVIYKLRNAHVLAYPFPHFYVEDVFPQDFYWAFRKGLPEDENYQGEPTGKFANRRFASPAEQSLSQFENKYFAGQVIQTFAPWFHERFADGTANIQTEFRLVRDAKGYSIGPHTDAPWKIVSLLFYMPIDHSHVDAGTSIFIPSDRQFTNEGGPHFAFEGFEKVWTAPYKPNSCFGFFKTSNSWHGVEEIKVKIQRDVLLYNIFDAGPAKK